MRLLVTGGAGYIGSIVASHLLAAEHEVVVLDNLRQGHREAVPDGARLVVADLLDPDDVNAVVGEGFDGVLHFAALALVGESVSHPERYYRTNVGGTLTLLQAMVAAEVPRLVFSSTCAVYGQPRTCRYPRAPRRGPSTLGRSKLAATDDWRLLRGYGLGAVSSATSTSRALAAISARHDPETHLIPNILRAALGINPMSRLRNRLSNPGWDRDPRLHPRRRSRRGPRPRVTAAPARAST